jgi:hypothetical protein
MSDAAALPFPAAVPTPEPRARTAPPRRPRRPGPVLMGDLTASWGGRPLLLAFWDPPDEG